MAVIEVAFPFIHFKCCHNYAEADASTGWLFARELLVVSVMLLLNVWPLPSIVGWSSKLKAYDNLAFPVCKSYERDQIRGNERLRMAKGTYLTLWIAGSKTIKQS